LPDGTVSDVRRLKRSRGGRGIAQRLILCGHSHVARGPLADGRMIVKSRQRRLSRLSRCHPFPHVVEAGTPDARYASWSLSVAPCARPSACAYDHDAMAALARRNGQPNRLRAWRRDGSGSAPNETACAGYRIWSFIPRDASMSRPCERRAQRERNCAHRGGAGSRSGTGARPFFHF